MKYKNKIFTMLGGLGFLLSACASDSPADNGGKGEGQATGSLRFSIALETNVPATRVNNDGNSEVSHIGKGEKINRLIYAVYMVDEATGKYELDTPAHPVQTVMPVDFTNGKTVEFTVDNLITDQQYHFAFWAQNSESDAFDTSDLRCVEVKYKDSEGRNYANNDESRDAFCQVWSGSISSDPEKRETVSVILKRPLAQINVGTTGADYKNILQGVEVFPNLKITHSQISVNGVARFLNVVDNKILHAEDMAAIGRQSDEAFTNVTFDWNVIPAFMNMASIPTTNEDLLASPDEEYLRVDLNKDGDIKDYLTSFPTLASDGNTALTETFKYLSMCYVLAPAGVTGNATYGNIKVGFAEDAQGKNGSTTVNLVSANGGRNYRTNLLGGLGWVKDPNEPSGPGDGPGTDNPGGDPSDPSDPGDGPDNPGGDPSDPGDQPEIPEDPVPSLFLRTFRILIQTDFQGSYTTDKDQSWTLTWTQNTQE